MFECIICKLKYKEMNNNICIFCNIVSQNNKNNVYDITIGFTKKSQKDIIKCTYEYINNNDKIPLPHEIDNKVKIININPYIFREFISFYKKKEIYDDNINNFKIFFTNTIDLNKIKSKKFPLKYKLEKLDVAYINSDILLNDIDENYENLYKKFINNIYYNDNTI